MADLPSSKSKIQIEETRYKSTVSETTFQKVGGAINHILDNSVNQVGDVVQSILSEAQFQSLRGNNWVLMSGQDITGSDLNAATGIVNLPDATGNSAFFRQGASLGTLQSDQNRAHSHTVFYANTPDNDPGAGTDIKSDSQLTQTSGSYAQAPVTVPWSSSYSMSSDGGAEARPINYQMNFFIKINNDPT